MKEEIIAYVEGIYADLQVEFQAKQDNQDYVPQVGQGWERTLCQWAWFVGPCMAKKQVLSQYPYIGPEQVDAILPALYPVLEGIDEEIHPGLYMEQCIANKGEISP